MECHMQGHRASMVGCDPRSSATTLQVPHVVVTLHAILGGTGPEKGVV